MVIGMKAASRLLKLGKSAEVQEILAKGKEYFESKKLDWTLETIEKKWNELMKLQKIRTNDKGEVLRAGTNIPERHFK